MGSNFDDFLAADGLLEEVSAAAIKRVVAWQLTHAMKHQGMTKTGMAQRMGTSRAAVDRLLFAEDGALTLDTLTRAAGALGLKVPVELV